MKLSIVSAALLVSQALAFVPIQNAPSPSAMAMTASALEVDGESRKFDPFEDYAPGSSTEVAVKELSMGSGDAAAEGDALAIKYSGFIMSTGERLGKTESEYKFQLGSGNVMPGLDVALKGKKAGSKIQVKVPPSFAYGEKGRGKDEFGRGGVPPNSDLQFEVEVTRLVSGPMAPIAVFGEGRAVGVAACVAVMALSPLLS